MTTLSTWIDTDMFMTPLRIEKIGERTWILIDNLVFYSKRFHGKFTIPRGFQTNFASIPRIFWTLLPPVGNYDRAAVLHDAAYANALLTAENARIFLIKEFCDNIFFDAMMCDGVGPVKSYIMYEAVSIGGDAVGHPTRLKEPDHG